MDSNCDREKIIKKVASGKKLTHDEELFFLTKIVCLPQDHAEGIIKVAKDQNKSVIFDLSNQALSSLIHQNHQNHQNHLR